MSVTIASNASNNTICSGTQRNLYGHPVNGGSNPALPVVCEHVAVGTATPLPLHNRLVNGDVVTVVLTSDLTPCATGNPATSNAITMVVEQQPAGQRDDRSNASKIRSVPNERDLHGYPGETAVVQPRLTSGM